MIISPLTPRNSRLRVARGKAAAIDHDAVAVVGFDVAVEADRAAGFDEARMQLRQHAARLDMAFVGIKQAVAETAFQRGFDLGHRGGIEPPVAGGHFGEAVEIGAVARMRHHQRAVERGLRKMLAPQIERAQARAGRSQARKPRPRNRAPACRRPNGWSIAASRRRCARAASPCGRLARTATPARRRQCLRQ